MLHELDKHFSMETDHSCFDTGTIGKSVGEYIKEWQSQRGIQFPYDAKYLGLAAGCGNEELALARFLGIKDRNVTLLDIRFQKGSRERYARSHPRVTLVESGMFAYLGNPQDRNFSLVTALGIEHQFMDGELPFFIRSLPALMREGGFVCVFQSPEVDARREWRKAGFVPSPKSDRVLLLYQFKPK